jgi:hypothetical protein
MMNDEAREAFGVFVGSVSRGEALRSLHGHEMRTALVYIDLPDGQPLLFAFGVLHGSHAYNDLTWTDEQAEQEDEYLVGGEQALGPGGTFPVVIEGQKAWLRVPDGSEYEQHTGGIRVLMPGGTTLTIVFWQDLSR